MWKKQVHELWMKIKAKRRSDVMEIFRGDGGGEEWSETIFIYLLLFFKKCFEIIQNTSLVL